MLHAVRRIVLAGLVAAIAVAVGGWAIGRSRFGASDQDAIARLETELRQQFLASADTLGRIATDLAAAQRQAINAADLGQAAPRRLFDAVDAALADQEPGRTGVTIYDAADAPVAWGGRTSELPRSRLDGPSTLFVAPDALGPRLVRIEAGHRSQPARPDADRHHRRRTTAGSDTWSARRGGYDRHLVDDRAGVAARAGRRRRRRQGRTRSRFRRPAADRWSTRWCRPADLADARARWRDGVRAAVLSIVVLTLLLCVGAMVDVRRRDRRRANLRDGDRRAAGHHRPGARRRVLCHRPPPWPATRCKPPVDLLLTAFTAVAMVWVTLDTIERWRAAGPRPRLLLGAGESLAWIGLAYFAAGIATTAIVWLYERKLRDVVSQSTFDLVQFSLHPLDGARITLTFGLVLLHAAVIWSAVAVTRLPSLWRTRRAFSRRSAATVAWVAGVALGLAAVRVRDATLSTSSLVWARDRRRQRVDRDRAPAAPRAAGHRRRRDCLRCSWRCSCRRWPCTRRCWRS